MSEWKTFKLGDISTQRKGISYKSEDYCDDQSGKPFITIKCFIKGGGYEPTGIKYFAGMALPVDYLKSGDILFAATDLTRAGDIVGSPLRVPFLGNQTALASMDCVKIEPIEPKCDKSFLYHRLMLSDIRRQMVAYSAGSTVLHLHTQAVPRMEVKLPVDTEVQRKIGGILDKFDLAIEKTEALIGKYRQIKAGLMHDLFTRGIGKDGKLRPPRDEAPELYKQTPIGWLPQEWDTDPLGEKIAVIDPNPSHRYPEEVDSGIPICSTENFEGDDDFDLEFAKYVPSFVYSDQNARCRFSETDVVFARKGKIGLARRYGRSQKVFSHTVVVMKPLGSDVNAHWSLWLTRSDWLLNGINKTMNTNLGVPTLGVDFIKKLVVPFPKTGEQEQMAAKLDAISSIISLETNTLKKLRREKSGLMRDLLTGNVPVEVKAPEAEHV